MYKRILSLAKPYWYLIAISLTASLLYVLFNTLSIWVTASLINNILTDFNSLVSNQTALEIKNNLSPNEFIKLWTNRVILKGTPVDTLWALCISILVIFFLKNIFLYLKNLLVGIVQFRVIRDLRNKLFDHITSLSMSFFDRKKAGELTSIVLNDVMVVRGSISVSFHKLLVEPINILAFSALLFIINWKLTLFSLVILPLAGIFIVTVGKSIRRKAYRSSKQVSGIVSILQEKLSSIRIVKSFVMERHERKKFKSETEKHYRLLRNQYNLRYASTPITEIMGVVIGVILLWLGGREVILYQSMDPEDFIRFVLILFSVLTPIKSMNTVNQNIQTAIASGQRIFSLLDTPRTITDSVEHLIIDDFSDKLEFRNVSFSYNSIENQNVIENISFSINKGEVVAVVGESGAGKSTLADLIPRFYDVRNGQITIDGIDIRKIKLQALRHQMGIVPQEIILFNDTIANNIAYGDETADIVKIRQAAEMANALEFILEQPQGFDTIVGERGVKLSGGQKQRISIARAILKNPPILIMDEATSSLDTKAEKKVQEAIGRLMIDRTVFVIAHRLSTIINADKIIVLKNGKIVEQGTHKELLKNNGHYQMLYQMQFGES